MDEDLTIINTNTRNQKIKDYFNKNKKLIISFLGILLLIIIGFYSYQIYKEGHREWLSNKYNNAIIKHKNGNNSIIVPELKAVIEDKDGTYSPLALYYLIDNNLIDNRDEINGLFDILIEKTMSLVPRKHRYVIKERTDVNGSIIEPINTNAFKGLVKKIKDENFERPKNKN